MTPIALPLLLVRHAHAEDSHPLGDAARGLTPEGRALFRIHARKLARMTPLTGILTSPLVRAVQTAELLADALGLGRVEVHPDLRPVRRAARRIVDLAHEYGGGWAFVGHNPFLKEAARLLIGPEAPTLRLKKGAAVALALDGAEHPFRWLLSPGRAPVKSLSALR
ncbi:MAG: histidine phosphatase family protein [Myxococcaceae bacterium]|nr:histidine phosphatase family protein [Myxococcaceae bacterium]MCI0672986.1 histidine phosphatase family protein [Myxococcaceae bacterium]